MTLTELIDGITRCQKDQEKVVTATLIQRLLYHQQALDIPSDLQEVTRARQWSSDIIRQWVNKIQRADTEWVGSVQTKCC